MKIRFDAFSHMFLDHIRKINDKNKLNEEVTSIAFNIADLLLEGDFKRISDKREEEIVEVIEKGIRKLIQEHLPEKYVMLNRE